MVIDTEVAEGWRSKDNVEAQYIKILGFQLRFFDHIWHFSNPIVIIQRKWRLALIEKRKARVAMKASQQEALKMSKLMPTLSEELSFLK